MASTLWFQKLENSLISGANAAAGFVAQTAGTAASGAAKGAADVASGLSAAASATSPLATGTLGALLSSQSVGDLANHAAGGVINAVNPGGSGTLNQSQLASALQTLGQDVVQGLFRHHRHHGGATQAASASGLAGAASPSPSAASATTTGSESGPTRSLTA
ncbi:MAG: hypothetical protein ACHP84_04725 [Caulobacterales bacterium]